jgi:hypothetical protein
MHPLFGADLKTLIQLLRRDGPVAIPRWPVATAAALASATRAPFTLGERRYVAWRRRGMAPMPPPVFIVGHWRSGTTHLYNIMSKAGFGFVSPFAAGLPEEFMSLGRWLRPLLTAMLPRTRFVDQMAVWPDSPQEDEIPLGSITPISFYHGVYFPRHFERHLKRSLFLDDCTPDEIEAWKRGFRRFTEKLWLDQNKRLLIKNPTYTARIPMLRAIYPDARFIHIYRNPHDVFRSTRRFYRALLARFAWQEFDHLDIDGLVIETYRRMMERFEVDRQDLPSGHFADLCFEDLETRPLGQIRRIFRQLDLGDVRPFEPAINAYLDSVQGFQKTIFPEHAGDRALVEHRCAALFERFGYAISGT